MPPRIAPLEPPYPPDMAELLRKMTPPAAPDTLALFRVLAKNPLLAERSMAWAGYLLGRKASLPLRDREVVIDRACARCGAEYEWGVHAAAFRAAAGFTPEQERAIATGRADDPALKPRDALLVRLIDELHETCTVSDELWTALASQWSEPQLVELLLLAGWYRAISYLCNAARVPLETWAARWPAGAQPA
jgi:alkylhydroperoxidase family enzyme